MKPRLNIVTLGVKNLKNSVSFYSNLFSRKPGKGSDDNIAFFNHDGIIVSLFPFEKLAADAGLPAEKSRFPGITLSINCSTKEDVDVLYRRAVVHSAGELVKPHETFWGGYGAYFSDPDGYAWEIAWAPFWEFDE